MLIGASAEVITPLAPVGQVKVDGVIWRARGAPDAGAGGMVKITGVDGLTLEVEEPGPP